jgi:hypothetical protein
MVTSLHSGPWYSNANVKARKIRRMKKFVTKISDPYMKYSMGLQLKDMLLN